VAIGARLLSLEGEYLAFFLLAKDFRPSPLFRWRAISCIAVARFVINPLLTSTILHMVTTRTNLLGPTDSRTCAVLSFVILMQGLHATGAKLGRYAANGESNGASDAYDDSADYPVLSGDCARHVSHEPHLGGDRCDRILIFALEKGR
jgi:hypothetical protein